MANLVSAARSTGWTTEASAGPRTFPAEVLPQHVGDWGQDPAGTRYDETVGHWFRRMVSVLVSALRRRLVRLRGAGGLAPIRLASNRLLRVAPARLALTRLARHFLARFFVAGVFTARPPDLASGRLTLDRFTLGQLARAGLARARL